MECTHPISPSYVKYVRVYTGIYQYVLVCINTHWPWDSCTGTDQYIQIHIGMYLHKQKYDIITNLHACIYQDIRVHTGTVRHVSIKKKWKQDSNPKSYAYCSQNLPMHYGLQTLSRNVNSLFLTVYIAFFFLTRVVRAPGASNSQFWCCLDWQWHRTAARQRNTCWTVGRSKSQRSEGDPVTPGRQWNSGPWTLN